MRISDWSSDVCSSDLPSPSSSRIWVRCAANCSSTSTRVPRSLAIVVPAINTSSASVMPLYMDTAPRLGKCPESLAQNKTPKRDGRLGRKGTARSEEHTSELQSLMRTSYAVFCLKKQKDTTT